MILTEKSQALSSPWSQGVRCNLVSYTQFGFIAGCISSLEAESKSNSICEYEFGTLYLISCGEAMVFLVIFYIPSKAACVEVWALEFSMCLEDCFGILLPEHLHPS